MTFASEKVISPRRVEELIIYDPSTGDITWRETRKGRGCKAGWPAGFINHNGYRVVCLDYEHVMVHRAAFAIMTGEWPALHMQVDHINRVRSDNRWENLRLVTAAENRANVRRSWGNTGHRGVHRNRHGRYVVSVANRLYYSASSFDEAVSLYRRKHVARYREFSPWYEELKNEAS